MDFGFISDPNSFTGKVITGVMVKLTTNIIEAASGKVAKRFKGEPFQKALETVLGKSLACALENRENLIESESKSDKTHLQRFFEHEDVLDELWHLLEGQEPDFKALEKIYADHFGEVAQLPMLRNLLNDFTDAFLELATKDEVLRKIIEVQVSLENLKIQRQILSTQLQSLAVQNKPYKDARQRYLFHLYQYCENQRLNLFGDVRANQQQKIGLQNVFIQLNTTSKSTVKKRGSQNTEKKETAQIFAEPEDTLSALEATIKEKQIVLLGNPGSGKSTFVKHLCAVQAAAILGEGRPLPNLKEEILPVLIPLREISDAFKELDLKNLTQSIFDREFLGIIENYFTRMKWSEDFARQLQREYLERGKCLLVFDGLDEVPPNQRAAVRRGIETCQLLYKPLLLIVTCRINAYNEGRSFNTLKEFTLAPLNSFQIEEFITRWLKSSVAIGQDSEAGIEEKIKELKNIVKNPVVRDLANNPMLLAILVMLYQTKIRLPEQRVVLFRQIIWLLIEDWQKAKNQIPDKLNPLFRTSLKLLNTLGTLAWAAHDKESGQTNCDLSKETALKLIRQSLEEREDLSEAFLEFMDQKAGIFVRKASDPQATVVYSFSHRNFQGYLAACYLVNNNRTLRRDILECLKNPDLWEDVIQLGVEELFYNQSAKLQLLDLAYLLVQDKIPALIYHRRGVVLAGEIIRILGWGILFSDENYEKGWFEKLQNQLTDLLQLPDFPVRDRCKAGVKLGQLEDTRQPILDLDSIEFAHIPSGPFWIDTNEKFMRESKKRQRPNEELSYSYFLSQFPLSNSQYRTFVNDKGYLNQRWWSEARQIGYWNTLGFKKKEGDKARTAPSDYDSPFNLPNHPVVGVSWFEALAFCHWLTARWQAKGWLPANWEVLLPSELEWEKGARGGLQLPEEPLFRAIKQGINFKPGYKMFENPQAQRRYPWGESPNPEHLNIADTRIEGTNALGIFPMGVSPYGLEEMVGGVREWTRSLQRDFPYNPNDGRENLNIYDSRVLRGGSFNSKLSDANNSSRDFNLPDIQFNDYGFRIVLVPIKRTAEP